MTAVRSSLRLALLSVVIAFGAIAAYVMLLGVPIVRNHPEGYVIAFALATFLPIFALWRGYRPRWPSWVALFISSLLLVAGRLVRLRRRAGTRHAARVPHGRSGAGLHVA